MAEKGGFEPPRLLQPTSFPSPPLQPLGYFSINLVVYAFLKPYYFIKRIFESHIKMKEFKITHNDANQRVDKFVKKYLKNAPLSFIYKTFRKKISK